jgi:hypothetical protein
VDLSRHDVRGTALPHERDPMLDQRTLQQETHPTCVRRQEAVGHERDLGLARQVREPAMVPHRQCDLDSTGPAPDHRHAWSTGRACLAPRDQGTP